MTSRYYKNEYNIAGSYYPVDAAAVRRQNTSNQAFGGTYLFDNNGRVTWAINDKQKFQLGRVP